MTRTRPGVRPTPRDQPSEEETDTLAETLYRVVRERQRLIGADVVVRGPGSRLVHVELEGDQAWLALTEHGAVVVERTMDAAALLSHLGAAPRFSELLAVLDGD